LPLLPVIFLLFLAPLFGPRSRFGYVDGIMVYYSGCNSAQAGQFAAQDADRCIKWLRDNGIPVDSTKTEFLRLAKGLKLDSTPVTLLDHAAPVAPRPNVRYLGVWLDPTLKFKTHAQEVAARGQRLANCIRRLNNTLRGLPPVQAAKVARACGTATVMYAAEAWWPGATKVSQSIRNKVVSTNKGYLEDILDKPLKALDCDRSALVPWCFCVNLELREVGGKPPVSRPVGHHVCHFPSAKAPGI